MNLKIKKNTLCACISVILCLIVYQFYIFSLIMSEPQSQVTYTDLVRKDFFSYAKKFVNENGILRGISPFHFEKYKPNKYGKFKCVYSKEIIPHEQVNDNYCDCLDGSDEPSTNACPDGVFYCSYQFPRAIKLNIIATSMINDGICDCCDGSDEWELPNGFKTYLTQGFHNLTRHRAKLCPNVCPVKNHYIAYRTLKPIVRK